MNPIKLQCVAAAVAAMFAAGAMADSLLMADNESTSGMSTAPATTPNPNAAQGDIDDAARMKCQTAADEAACLEQERARMSSAVPPNSDTDTTTTVDPDAADTGEASPAIVGSPGADGTAGGDVQY